MVLLVGAVFPCRTKARPDRAMDVSEVVVDKIHLAAEVMEAVQDRGRVHSADLLEEADVQASGATKEGRVGVDLDPGRRGRADKRQRSILLDASAAVSFQALAVRDQEIIRSESSVMQVAEECLGAADR